MDYIKELWKKNKQAIIDGLLEVGRLAVLAIIPILIDRFTGQEMSLELQAGILVALRFLDKVLHSVGKRENNELLLKGITRF